MPPKKPTPRRSAAQRPPIKTEGADAAVGNGPEGTGAPAGSAPDVTGSGMSTHQTPSAPRGRITAKPRAGVRRTLEARAEAEREAAAQRSREAADRAKREARRMRGAPLDASRRGGRGRGGFMGERDRTRTLASGPFSAGQASADTGSWRRLGASGSGGGTYFGGGSGGGGGGGTTSGSASRSTAGSGGKGIKQEDGGEMEISRPIYTEGEYISSEDDDETDKGYARKNVDEMMVIDLTKDLADDPTEYLVPIRAPRREHKERRLGLVADGAASAEAVSQEIANESGSGNADKRKGKQRAKEVEFMGEREKFQSTYSSSDTEPETKVKQESAEGDAQVTSTVLEPEKASRTSTKARTRSDHRPPQPVFQTAEEIEEWKIQQHELETMQDELGTVSTSMDTGEDAVMGDTEPGAKQKSRREDHVFLFQFPPVLPDLEAIPVKPDPDGAHNDAMDADEQNRGTTVEVDAKQEDETGTQPKLPSGAVGKLKIHKSGKATLDWGGLSFKLGLGSDIAFLQQVYIMTMPEGKEREEDKATLGQAVNMGRVRGKFVVSPDWDEL